MFKNILLLLCLMFVMYSSANPDFLSESGIYTVPTGIYELTVGVEDGNGSAISFRLRVQPNDVLSITIDGASTSLSNSDGDVLASADGSSTSGSAGLLEVGSYGTGSGQGVSISYYDACPTSYTNVHSDFDPELLPESSLYNINGNPELKIDFQLPEYYYEITAEYGATQCSGNSGDVVTSSDPAGCNTIHRTSVNHQDHCSFSLTDQGDGTFIYQGVLTINAKLNLDLNGYGITRTVSAPLSWQVSLKNEITVHSNVEVQENNLCYTNNDCTGDQGCCEAGVCNCNCGTSAKTGYSGDLCEEDTTAPLCDSGCVTHTLQSYHGGSINAFERGLYSLPVFSDNSGSDVIIVSIKIGEDIVDDETYSFPIGETTVTYTVKDPADPVSNSATFSYTIIVEDKRAPEVDCHECQSADAGSLNVCVGTAIGWDQDTLTFAEYEALISDPSIKSRGAVNPSYLPGQDIFSGETYAGQLEVSAGYLGCDCQKIAQSPSYASSIITNAWDSWAAPTSYDIEDGARSVTGEADPDADGSYNVLYRATDAAGNQGTCTKREIIYDITDPSCENNFYAAPAIDPDNKNFSVEVTYDEAIFNPSYGISGKGPDPYLDEPRDAVAAYHVGYAEEKNYTSDYHIEDAAGNTAICSWKVHVDNPTPCIYPICDDAAPQAHDCPESVDLVFDCADNLNCGCGKWTPPTFTDDKFVKKIDVYVDGVFLESYNNGDTSHTAPTTSLKLGSTPIRYVAYDMHDKTAECNFSVTYSDGVDPSFDGTCPTSESINTATANSDYTYSIDYSDECSLNTAVGIQTIAGESISDKVTDKVVNLAIGEHDFHYRITDDSTNTADCQFTITIVDNVNPSIECPDSITDRLDQGQDTKSHTYSFIASDTGANPDPTVEVSHPSGTAFPSGETLVTAVATDAAGNTKTCTFTVTHEESYPFATFEAALVGADVNEDNGSYGADLQVYSFVNVNHRVTGIASSDGQNLSVSNIAPTDCDEGAAVCQQNWGTRVSFSECLVENSSYAFTASVECRPTDCSEAKTFDFTVLLDVANFCWQDLESVGISATLTTTSKTKHDDYITAYNANPATASFDAVTSFANGDHISGIVSVSSPNVQLSNVDIVSASAQHYNDADRTDPAGSSVDVLQNEVNKATIASFTYQESSVPLEDQYWTTYTANVAVTYNLPSGSSRRMLLSTDESSESINKIVTAETVSFGSSNDNVEINPEDAVVVLKLTQCDASDELTQGLTQVIAQALRIDVSRVNVLVSESTCFVQVSIAQLDCDTSDITLVLEQFETAVTDPFHDIHTIMYNNEDISMEITFDYGTFFVSQLPTTVTNASALYSASSADSSSSLDWYVYLATGIAVGALVTGYIKSKKN